MTVSNRATPDLDQSDADRMRAEQADHHADHVGDDPRPAPVTPWSA